jgi:hypothetical protein
MHNCIYSSASFLAVAAAVADTKRNAILLLELAASLTKREFSSALQLKLFLLRSLCQSAGNFVNFSRE